MLKEKSFTPALFVLISGILWGTINIFVINLDRYGLNSMQISLIRMIISVILYGLFLLITDREKLKIKIKDIWMFACTGIVSVTVFNTLFFYVCVNGESSIAVTLLNTAPAFVMILSAIFFKEKITGQKVVALIMTIVGCFFITGVIGGAYRASALIIALGIASGFFYALYSIFTKIALKKYETETCIFWTFVMALIGSIPFGKPVETFTTVLNAPVSIWFCLGIGIFCTVIPYFLFTWGLKRMDPSKAQILACIEPLVATVIAIAFYGDSVSVVKIIGIVLIVASTVVLNINFTARKTEKNSFPKQQ